MDMSKLTLGDKVIGVSAILLLIFSFFPWFEATVSVEGGDLFSDISQSASGNGWDIGFLWSGIPVILGLAMLAYVVITRFSPDTSLPDAPWGKILLGIGVLAALLVVLKLLIGVDEQDLVPGGAGIPDDFFEELDLEVSRQFGIFLAALAAIGLAVGGFLKMQEGEDAAGGASPAGPPQAF